MAQSLSPSSQRKTRPGSGSTLGAVIHDDGVNFALFSARAEQVFLLLFDNPADHATDIIELERNGDSGIWHILVEDTHPGQLYGYKVTGPYDVSQGLRFNPHKLLIDPYARALTGKFRDRDRLLYGFKEDGQGQDFVMDSRDNTLLVPKCIVTDGAFDWGNDAHPGIPPGEMVIYETHLRGFTAHPSSGVSSPGTYLGFVEKIPYLRDLGITSVELLPVHEHHIRDELVQKGLSEYWGYNTIGFFAPESSYATDPTVGSQANEFKTLVKEMHRAGMEVILDVVYNHTGEGDHLGPTLCFRGIDNPSYYALEGPEQNPHRFYRDVTGCRNTLDIEKPAVFRLVMDSLRYWVQEMHVDGFRFDLATVMGYSGGSFSPDNRFFEALNQDPVLGKVKLIAEPWDIATRETGRFPAPWMEWNDSFRDTVRRFIRGDSGQVAAFATRFSGSQDMFGAHQRSACSSINFITAHDGFTLNDLYSYEEKHNEENGEGNRDGTDNNNAFNCGVEGGTRDREVLMLRRRMARNGLLILLCSRGVPMLLGGDEVLRTQRGNNNAYCQDNETSWFAWDSVERNHDIYRFCRSLIEFRGKSGVFNGCSFYSGESSADSDMPDIAWYGADLNPPDWHNADGRLLCCEITLAHAGGSIESSSGGTSREESHSLFMIFNMDGHEKEVSLPHRENLVWHLLCDTAHEEGSFHHERSSITRLNPQHRYSASPRTVTMLIGAREDSPHEHLDRET